tara:strand:- start:37 stop:591 length:555 start_codon:yes stop_codon:yes gene_type:complete
MAEVEVGGIKFSGGKFFIVISVVSTLAGSLWAGFEFYADYMDMKEIVQEINIDEIKAENELVISKLDNAIVYTRDIKNNLRDDLLKLEVYIDKIDKKVEASGDRIKSTQASIDLVLEDVLNEMNQVQKDVTVSIREVEALIRESEKDVRDNLRETEARLDQSMKKLEYTINQRLQELLDNPLSN